MTKTAYKEQLIEKISYLSSSQSVSYREILKINDKKILVIKKWAIWEVLRVTSILNKIKKDS